MGGVEAIPKDKRVYKQTFTMGIPKETATRLPSQYLRRGKGIDELSRKIDEARTIRRVAVIFRCDLS